MAGTHHLDSTETMTDAVCHGQCRGTGYNGCPGRQFAFAEIGKITATVLRDFDFELEHPDSEWDHRSHFTVAQQNWPVRIRLATDE